VLELALHVLDILQNAVEAGAASVVLEIEEDRAADRLRIVVSDNGRGIPPEALNSVINPFHTTRTSRHVGLGLPLFAAAAERAGGRLAVYSPSRHLLGHGGQPLGPGTTVEATFVLSHPDRQPLGDLTDTLLSFLLSAQSPELCYMHRVDGETFTFDTTELRAQLDGLPLSHPLVYRWLSEFIAEGEAQIRATDSSGASAVQERAECLN